jgi:GNAT superfamily N-acetyltransferase
MYSLSASEVRPTCEGRGLRRDAIDDLLLYRPFAARDRRREDFLEVARRRLAQGQHVYTFAADGALLHYSWLEEGTERAGSEFDHEFRLPGPAAILWDDYTRPDARGRGLQTRSIHRRLQDAAAGGQTRMFIGVRADNAISRHNIEKVGFTHWASGWARYRLGHVKRWITYARPDTGLDAAPGLAPTRVAAVPRHLWP